MDPVTVWMLKAAAVLAIAAAILLGAGLVAKSEAATPVRLERADAVQLTRLQAIAYWMEIAFATYDWDGEIYIGASVSTCRRLGARTLECDYHAKLYWEGGTFSSAFGTVHLELRRGGRMVSWLRPYQTRALKGALAR